MTDFRTDGIEAHEDEPDVEGHRLRTDVTEDSVEDAVEAHDDEPDVEAHRLRTDAVEDAIE